MHIDVQVGDTITLTIPASLIEHPYSTILTPGSHEMRVTESLAAKDGNIHIKLLAKKRPFIVAKFLIIPSPKLIGFGFLGNDQFPVPYQLTPNLEMRLKRSLELLKKGKIENAK